MKTINKYSKVPRFIEISTRYISVKIRKVLLILHDNIYVSKRSVVSILILALSYSYTNIQK